MLLWHIFSIVSLHAFLTLQTEPSYEDDAGNGCSRSDQPDSPLSTAIEVFSDKDVNIQGYRTLTPQKKSLLHDMFLMLSYFILTCLASHLMMTGPDCVASVKTVTKFVKIVNPGRLGFCCLFTPHNIA